MAPAANAAANAADTAPLHAFESDERALTLDETRELFTYEYFKRNSANAAALALGIDPALARQWARDPEFKIEQSRLRKNFDDKHERALTGLVAWSLKEIEDRITEGEERMTREGSIVKIKPGISTLLKVNETLYARREHVRAKEEDSARTFGKGHLQDVAANLRATMFLSPENSTPLDVEVHPVASEPDTAPIERPIRAPKAPSRAQTLAQRAAPSPLDLAADLRAPRAALTDTPPLTPADVDAILGDLA